MVFNFNLLHLQHCVIFKPFTVKKITVVMLTHHNDMIYEMTKRNVMKLSTVVSRSKLLLCAHT